MIYLRSDPNHYSFSTTTLCSTPYWTYHETHCVRDRDRHISIPSTNHTTPIRTYTTWRKYFANAARTRWKLWSFREKPFPNPRRMRFPGAGPVRAVFRKVAFVCFCPRLTVVVRPVWLSVSGVFRGFFHGIIDVSTCVLRALSFSLNCCRN